MTAAEIKQQTLNSPNVQIELKPILDLISKASNGGEWSISVDKPNNQGVFIYLRELGYAINEKREAGKLVCYIISWQ